MISVDVCCHHYLKCGSAKRCEIQKDWMLVAPLYNKYYTSVVLHIKTNITLIYMVYHVL